MGRPTRRKALTHSEVEALREPGLYPVGEVTGLYVQVAKAGARTWILRYMLGGRRRDMGLGGFPTVKLADAKARARAARDLIEKHIDPIDARDEERAKNRAQAAERARIEARRLTTFKEAAESYIRTFEGTWKNAKHAAQWPSTLSTYAYPVIGEKPVHEVDTADVRAILAPIWSAKTETASRVRNRIEKVLTHAQVIDAADAKANGRDPTFPPYWQNPARWVGHLREVLPSPSAVRPVENFPALPYGRIGAFMQALREREGMGARCLEFAILTASRSGAARGARWSEIDFETKIWTIPAARMKGRRGVAREHRVPLSSTAVDLLEKLPRLAGTDLVFPAAGGGELSDATLGATIKRMNEGDARPTWIDKHGKPVVAHGFRSTFKDWTSERTSFPNEMSEVALAHKVPDKTEAAYRRGDMIERRRRMMNDWAAFCGKVEQQPKNARSVIDYAGAA